jgi:hypothetical protein
MDMDMVLNDSELDAIKDDAVVEQEPEEEGPRMTRLRGILTKSLQETLKVCNYNAIQECFPILASSNPDELREAHEKVCQFLKVEVEVFSHLHEYGPRHINVSIYLPLIISSFGT